jgi:hypothetical protein
MASVVGVFYPHVFHHPAMTPVFAVFTLIQLVPTVALLMRLRWSSSPSEGKGA